MGILAQQTTIAARKANDNGKSNDKQIFMEKHKKSYYRMKKDKGITLHFL